MLIKKYLLNKNEHQNIFGFQDVRKSFLRLILPAFRKHCFNRVIKRIRDLMPKIDDKVIRDIYKNKGWAKSTSYDEFCKKKETFIRLRETLKLCAEASSKLTRDFVYCIDCSLNVWLHKGKVYVIPYGETWIFDCFKSPDRVEDFSYWNNTDHPDDLTIRKWNARRKTWEEVCLRDWDYSRMVHDIVDAKKSIGLYEVGLKIVGKNDDLRGLTACLPWTSLD